MRGKKARGIIGIAFMALSVASMYLWLTYGQEALATKRVLIASTDIEQGTVIDSEKYFAEANIDIDLLINGGLTGSDLQAIKGMAAQQFIPQNSQISAKYFSNENLVVSGDKMVFKIPSSWIYAVPSSIRRGDDIRLYEIDSDIEKNLDAGSPESETELRTFSDASDIRLGADKPVLSASVLYVKDSTNREVVDADGRERFDGTSQVSSVEIACTRDEIKVLEEKVAEGMKFIIVYQ